MESHIVKIESVEPVTHDVKRFRLEKPSGYKFTPGQATEVSVNRPGWEEERRPFTFTSLNDDVWLEFTIKRYADHHGVTDLLHQLAAGDEIIIRDVWGAIEYKGPGYFIAGGAGITPFVAILRQLFRDNRINGNSLYFSNKTSKDIIYEKEFSQMLGENAHFILTREEHPKYTKSRIQRDFLAGQSLDFSRHFYVCGPDKMVEEISGLLAEMGAASDALVFEK
ncbi:FAD-binding oxidoreductase [Flavihumibacter solisilvae]|uniref:Flavodoxin reductase n=1 Tax=Flavihumibacter solisilvae TaxID=1349421 RepID=A0A0C1IZ82_9BACT|nr:FAD-binding oxidoreductase [Flavihumibacter solisilvae]KIC95809.1 flavodoxin reductase [Flavihumibacter solisilvae]